MNHLKLGTIMHASGPKLTTLCMLAVNIYTKLGQLKRSNSTFCKGLSVKFNHPKMHQLQLLLVVFMHGDLSIKVGI